MAETPTTRNGVERASTRGRALPAHVTFALWWLGVVGASMVVFVLALARDVGVLVACLDTFARSAWLPACYLLSAFGLGSFLQRVVWRGGRASQSEGVECPACGCARSRTVALCLGVAATLWMTHVLGCLGLLSARGEAKSMTLATLVGWASLAPGLFFAAQAIAAWLREKTSDEDASGLHTADAHAPDRSLGARSSRAAFKPSPWWFACAPACAIVLVCACSPPGWLWASEAGGYDALSYHLPLPQEWLTTGIRPLAHNIYSFLPSSLEGAFLHLAAIVHAPGAVSDTQFAAGFIARGGQLCIAAQLLHAFLGVLAAITCGKAAQSLVARCTDGGKGAATQAHRAQAASFAGAMTAAVVAWTPWSLVTGSLAYDEMGVLLMIAGVVRVLAAGTTRVCTTGDDRSGVPQTPGTNQELSQAHAHGNFAANSAMLARVWLCVAIFVAAAISIKLSVALMLALPAALCLFLLTPRRALARGAFVAALAGLVVIAPWCVRNVIASGNPVFPFFARAVQADALASPQAAPRAGQWTGEQLARFHASHQFVGSFADRLRATVLAMPDPGNPAASVHRGLMHPQWGWLFPLTLLALAAMCIHRKSLPRQVSQAAALLAASLAIMLLLWLFTTHVQSRFLLPLLPLCAIAIALCAGLVGAANLRAGAAVVVLGSLALATYNTVASQRAGQPLAAISAGVGVMTGESFANLSPPVEDKDLNTEAWMNLRLPARLKVLLVGDATPLYLRGDVTYATTWDKGPLAHAMEKSPGNPQAWSASLRAEGFEAVLLDVGELARLQRSGFLDPALKADDVQAWINTWTVPLAQWPNSGRFLLHPLSPEEKSQLDQARAAQTSIAPPAQSPAPESPQPPR